MLLRKWDELPEDMKTPEVKKYYELLAKRQLSLIFKRVFDAVTAFLMLAVLSPVILILSILIMLDSPGGAFFRQVRVTTYGKTFQIHKFRTMVANADRMGSQVTVKQDARVTKIGVFLRKYRLDELPQLLDVLNGTMSFVGTRPEVPKYVEQYTSEMKATLLLPAGITSEASILYKDEAEVLASAEDVDEVYINKILPEKMKYNLQSLERFSFWGDILTMIRTVLAIFK